MFFLLNLQKTKNQRQQVVSWKTVIKYWPRKFSPYYLYYVIVIQLCDCLILGIQTTKALVCKLITRTNTFSPILSNRTCLGSVWGLLAWGKPNNFTVVNSLILLLQGTSMQFISKLTTNEDPLTVWHADYSINAKE